MQEFEFDPALADLETRLRKLNLAPAKPAISRDRLLFEAGQAAARSNQKSRLFAFTTLIFAGCTMAIAYLLVCEQRINDRLNQELAEVRAGQILKSQMIADKPQEPRELPETSYVALMRRSDLFSEKPPIVQSPSAGSTLEATPNGPEMNVLNLRSKLDF